MADDGLGEAGAGRFCADCSREAGEQVFGTAPQVDVWLVLEYRGTWGAKAVKDNTLPPEVLAHLPTAIGDLAARPLFIRQTGRADHGLAFFVAIADELYPRLYEFTLADYEDLLTIDLAAVVRGGAKYAAHVRSEPLYLVCTNGKRDRSCAMYGAPLATAMTEVAGGAVWQSTHLGGHRFAATTLFLPEGVLYGHVDAEQAPALIKRHKAGQILPANYRGRSCYGGVEQAADYYLRQERGECSLTAFCWLETIELAESRWLVRFEERASRAVHSLELQHGPASVEVYLSSTDEAASAVNQYELLRYTVESAS
jgi:hypothetical protein